MNISQFLSNDIEYTMEKVMGLLQVLNHNMLRILKANESDMWFISHDAMSSNTTKVWDMDK